MTYLIIIFALTLIVAVVPFFFKKEKPVTLEEKHNRFDEILKEKITQYKKRGIPELGKRFIRREIDNLYETGYLEPTIIKEEYNKIAHRKSKLPLSQRIFIKNIVLQTALELDEEIRKESKTEK